MARHVTRKQKIRRLPGVKAAARELGCDYSHLRRVVLGLRESRSLMRCYRALNAHLQKTKATKE
jgi:hypothetical protein